mgnify:CR=1 FL=1
MNIQNGSPIETDSMVNTFYNAFNSFMDICVPKLPIIKQSGPPCSSRQLSKLKNKKNKLFKKYKDLNTIFSTHLCITSILIKLKIISNTIQTRFMTSWTPKEEPENFRLYWNINVMTMITILLLAICLRIFSQLLTLILDMTYQILIHIIWD